MLGKMMLSPRGPRNRQAPTSFEASVSGCRWVDVVGGMFERCRAFPQPRLPTHPPTHPPEEQASASFKPSVSGQQCRVKSVMGRGVRPRCATGLCQPPLVPNVQWQGPNKFHALGREGWCLRARPRASVMQGLAESPLYSHTRLFVRCWLSRASGVLAGPRFPDARRVC